MIGDGGGLFRVGVKDAAKLRKKPSRSKRVGKSADGTKSETSLHMNVAGYLDKHLAAPAWYTTFPAGGGGEFRGMILKGMGLKAGVPDILIIMPVTLTILRQPIYQEGNPIEVPGPYDDMISDTALVPLLYWIELKREGGTGEPSEAQKRMQQILIERGCRVANCNSMESVQAALREWGLPYQEMTPTEDNLRNSLKLALANV